MGMRLLIQPKLELTAMVTEEKHGGRHHIDKDGEGCSDKGGLKVASEDVEYSGNNLTLLF